MRPLTYEEGAYDFDGNLQTINTKVNSSTSSVTFESVTISGVITSVLSSNGFYIQDKNCGLEIYQQDFKTTGYEIGDFVTIEDCTAAQIYAKSGVLEVTAFGTNITKDSSKKTKIIKFAKIPSYTADFTSYVGNGTKLYAFRGTINEHTAAPDLIYVSDTSTFVKDAEKINIGVVGDTSAGVEFSVWKQLDADDSILALDKVPVENVTFTLSENKDNYGFYKSGTTVTMSCDTADAEIYYATQKFDLSDFEASNIDSTKFTKYTTAISVTEDTEYYAVAVKEIDGTKLISPSVKLIQVPVAVDVSYEAITTEKNYDFDGSLASLAEAKPTTASAAGDTEYSGIVVAFDEVSNKKTQFLVQDKDTGIYFYGVTLPWNAHIGSKIKFTVTRGSVFNGLYEVTDADITVEEAKASTIVYYKNITGESDFTEYTTGQLCAVRGLYADYQSTKATIYMKTPAAGENAFFGYIYNRNNIIQLVPMIVKNADTVSYPENYVAKPVFSTSGSVASGTKVTLSCAYPEDAKIYYQWIASTDTSTQAMTAETYSNESVSKEATDEGVAITNEGTLYAIAVKTSDDKTYTSDVASASYTIKADNVEESTLSELIQNTTSTTVGTTSVTVTKISGNNTSYYTSGGFRFYAKNSLTFEDTSKKIAGIEFVLDSTLHSNNRASSLYFC